MGSQGPIRKALNEQETKSMATEEKKSGTYPMSLYKGGDRNSAHVIVNDAAEEREQRAAGFAMIDKDADAAAKAALGGDDEAKAEDEPAPKAKGKK
jgi:hypothetical protein